MESKALLSILITLLISMTAAAAPAKKQSYRWIDESGAVHFGSAVPAEYADQPYDVINSSGLVIEHVEPGSVDPQVKAETVKQQKIDLKSEKERQLQSDRLLLMQYPTEEDLQKAMQLELDQVGYDSMLINKSYENTNAALIDKVRLAADQQRAGIPVTDAQTAELERMYRSLKIDKRKLDAISGQQNDVKSQFAARKLRYQALVNKNDQSGDETSVEESPSGDPASKDQN